MTEHKPEQGAQPATSGSVDPTVRPDDLPPQPSPVTNLAHGQPSRSPQSFPGFEVLRELGQGAFATVYLARQVALERLVALKVSPNLSQEARTLASLEHDYIVRVFSEQVDPGRNLRLMCMQYVPGATLARIIDVIHQQPTASTTGQAILDLVDARSPDPVALDIAALRDRERLAHLDLLEVVCWMGARLAEALAYAHARGVCHRDVKPANILVNRYGRPLLADFNVSAVERPRRPVVPGSPGSGVRNRSASPGQVANSATLTFAAAEEGIGGTLAYMAPEHIDAFNPDNFTGPEAVDQRSDIFSLGVVLYEFLTGKLPFDGEAAACREDFLQALADERRGPPPPLPPALRAPAMLERILAHSMAGNPAHRYSSAAEFAADLDSCRVMLRVQRRLPRGYIVTRLALRAPFLVGAALVIFPHLLATIVNIGYNFSRIVGHLSAEQQRAFFVVTLGYNLLIYPITVGLYVQQLLPLIRLWRQLARPGSLGSAVVDAARRRALALPWWVVGLSAGGWFLGGIVWPLGIYLLAGTLAADDAVHFLISFTISGLIAMTYAVIAVEFIVVRVLYPGLWLDARNLRAVAQEELRFTERRLVAWQLLAVLIPSVGAVFMVLVGPDSFVGTNYWTFRLLVTALLGLGMVGLGLALVAAGLLRQTIAVLTATGSVGSAGASPRDSLGRNSAMSSRSHDSNPGPRQESK